MQQNICSTGRRTLGGPTVAITKLVLILQRHSLRHTCKEPKVRTCECWKKAKCVKWMMLVGWRSRIVVDLTFRVTAGLPTMSRVLAIGFGHPGVPGSTLQILDSSIARRHTPCGGLYQNPRCGRTKTTSYIGSRNAHQH
jgi:hypothetical protein